VGHSWGSYLGVGIVRRRPDLFAAYVGTDQVASWREAVRAQFDFLLRRARQAEDGEKVAQLEAIGDPDPMDAHQYFGWWSMRNRYMPPADAKWFDHLKELVRNSPDFTDADMKTFAEGMSYSGETVLSAMLHTDLPATARDIGIPFFVIQGADDMATPTSGAVRYFDAVRAPKKKLVLIPGAGHFALVTHREAFLEALLRDVRPVAIEGAARVTTP
jgi:pimeloyl-ACP methyl ester carboxylesterase